MELLSQQTSFEGRYIRYRHASSVNHCDMVFSIYVPPSALQSEQALATTPVIYWLSGLTCTDENFMQKAGAHRLASDLGLVLVAPDTSPRGSHVPDDKDGSYDFGHGAGFYLNATQAPWAENYNMYDYVVSELPELLSSKLGIKGPAAISGHSMGGHGALTIALKNPDRFSSVSAFSPIGNPTKCPWGKKAFSNYLGDYQSLWEQYDACVLLGNGASHPPLLIDQGTDDQFLEEQLGIPELEAALTASNGAWQLNMRESYDHSYFFIATFIGEHLRFHAEHLKNASR